jgi:hypothetical protein
MTTTATTSSHVRVAEHRPWNYYEADDDDNEEDYDRNNNYYSDDDDDDEEEDDRVRIVRMNKNQAKHGDHEDEDAKIEAHYEKSSHESKRKPRVTLTMEKLTGVDGLIRIPHEFARTLKKKHASFLSSSSVPTASTAASYATQLVDLYADFAHSIWPHTHMLDVFYKIEQLGSKPTLKAFLELQRQEITRNPYLEKTLGRENAETLIQNLQEYHKQLPNHGEEPYAGPIGNDHFNPGTTQTTRATEHDGYEEEEEHEATFEEEAPEKQKQARLLPRSVQQPDADSSTVHAITPHKRSNEVEGDSEDEEQEMEATFEEEIHADVGSNTENPTSPESQQSHATKKATSPLKLTKKFVADEESDDDIELKAIESTFQDEHENIDSNMDTTNALPQPTTTAQPEDDTTAAAAGIISPRKRSRQVAPDPHESDDDDEEMEATFDDEEEANVPTLTETTSGFPSKSSEQQLDATATDATSKARSPKKQKVAQAELDKEEDNDEHEMKATFEESVFRSGTENIPTPQLEQQQQIDAQLESADSATPAMSNQKSLELGS